MHAAGLSGMTVPTASFMLFQGMFFIITPALICGAFAERMKFSTMVVFMILWGTLDLLPAWPTGSGAAASWLTAARHATGIFAGGALGLRRRNGGAYQFRRFGPDLRLVDRQAAGLRQDGHAAAQPDLYGHRRRAAVGRLVRLQCRQRRQPAAWPASAFMATHLLPPPAGLTWAGLEWVFRGKPRVLGACSGVVAGLVCITPASGFVTPMPALSWAWPCPASASRPAPRSRAASATTIPWTPSACMASAAPWARSSPACSPPAPSAATAAITTIRWAFSKAARCLKGQIVAVLITWVLAVVGTFMILKVLDATMGLRVSREDEIEGLDFSQHGEEGYIFI